jgi:hypothetical protein
MLFYKPVLKVLKPVYFCLSVMKFIHRLFLSDGFKVTCENYIKYPYMFSNSK